jgi:hypothetical protein
VVIEKFDPANPYQQWYMIQSSFPEYYYIANSTIDDPSMKVIRRRKPAGSPLFLESMVTNDIYLNQVWSFRQPPILEGEGSNKFFTVTNANSGLVMAVEGGSKTPGHQVIADHRNIKTFDQQFFFKSYPQLP